MSSTNMRDSKIAPGKSYKYIQLSCVAKSYLNCFTANDDYHTQEKASAHCFYSKLMYQ